MRGRTIEYLCDCRTPADLLGIRADSYDGRRVTAEDVAAVYRACGGYWLHSGIPTHHHVVLASGRHSNGFANGRIALSYGNICRLFALQVAGNIRCFVNDLDSINVVLTASYGGNDMGAHLAEILGARHIYTEKDGSEQVLRSFTIRDGELVLPFEELITTGGTARKMIEAVNAAHQHPIRYTRYLASLDPSQGGD